MNNNLSLRAASSALSQVQTIIDQETNELSMERIKQLKYCIDNPRQLKYFTGYQLNASPTVYGRLDVNNNSSYIVFGPIYVKKGSRIGVPDDKKDQYKYQVARYNMDESNNLQTPAVQFSGITTSSNPREISGDGYIRFAIKKTYKNNEGSSEDYKPVSGGIVDTELINDLLNNLEVHLITQQTINEKISSIANDLQIKTALPALPSEANAGTYILTATIDNESNISYNWVPQQS